MGGMVISIEFIPIYVAKGSVKIKVIIFYAVGRGVDSVKANFCHKSITLPGE